MLDLLIQICSFSFSLIGIFMIFWGGLDIAITIVWKELKNKENDNVVEVMMREKFASKLILGLEFFIAVDVIKTVQEQTFVSLGQLAILVVIRSILSYFLNKEIVEAHELEQEIYKSTKNTKKA